MDEKANWNRRAEIIDYCVQVLDDKPPDHRSESGDARPPHPPLSVGASDEAKYRQVRNELAIEKIVRQRSIDAFASRCRYFEPPRSDEDGRRWWDEARKRQ